MDQLLKQSIDQCVLCWLATSSIDQVPNVSPKEIFTSYGDDSIIIANIASPQSIENISQNDQVCVSFIDIFLQKGYQVKGTAQIIDRGLPAYVAMEKPLLQMTRGKYPFKSIIKVDVWNVKPIIAPSYILYPEMTNADREKSALKTYGVRKSEK